MIIYNSYIYLWYDTKAKLFYLGGHKGKVDDSYVCSSKTMLRAYKLRSHTFKLKVLQYLNGSNKDLRDTEQSWLNRIDDKELMTSENVKAGSCRYYNVKKHAVGGNGSANKGKKRSKPSWSKGLTKEMILLRRQGNFFLLSDRPKTKPVVKVKSQKEPHYIKTWVFFNKCRACSSIFASPRKIKQSCSVECNKELIARTKRNKPAWNKGLNNHTAAFNGKASAAKQSITVTGRKMCLSPAGKRYWKYADHSVARSVS